MCITEYNEVKTLADERQEGAVMMLFNLVKKGLLTEERAAEEAQMSIAEFRERARLATT